MPHYNLKSMKLSKEEQRENNRPASESDEEYPWGLRIHLSDTEVAALGEPALRAGEEVLIYAKATVKTVSSREEEGKEGEVDISMSLQITDMALEEEAAIDRGKQAKRLYSGSDT